MFSEADKQTFGISETVFDLRSVTPFWAGQVHPRLQFDDISSCTGAWRGSSSWCSSPWIRSEPSQSGTEASMRTGSETDEEKREETRRDEIERKQAKWKDSRGHDVNLHQNHCSCKSCVLCQYWVVLPKEKFQISVLMHGYVSRVSFTCLIAVSGVRTPKRSVAVVFLSDESYKHKWVHLVRPPSSDKFWEYKGSTRVW